MIDVELKTIEPTTVAFVSMHGAYSQVPQAMGQLYGWVAQHGLAPVGMPSAVYLTDPAQGEATAQWEVRTALAGEPAACAADPSGCGIKTVPSQLVASTMYRGPYEQIALTYGEMAAWIAANSYGIAGPPEELYYSDPADTAPQDYLTEIRFPIGPG